jgi:D-alanyl-D-alanine carboxypeptidase/D-alanyl-D-alanine-endopeptidase (penicillin-binding protein 4)
MRRLREPFPLALVVALLLTMAATAIVVPGGAQAPAPPARPAASPSLSPRPRPAPPAVLAAAPRIGAPGGVGRALAGTAADAAFARGLAGVVADARTGRPLYAVRPDTPEIPASTAKLVTAAAAMSVLDPDARLVTRVVRGPKASVVLVGGGDPTLGTPAWRRVHPAASSLDRLAADTARALLAGGVRRVSLGLDASRFAGPVLGPGWKRSYLTGGDVAPVTALMVDQGHVRPDRRARHADPVGAAGAAFVALLRRHGVAVAGRPAPARAPAGAAVLATVSSAPLRDLVERMVTTSDNDLAEALAREVAGRYRLPRSFAGAAGGLRRALARLGVTGLALVDGSGLSRLNRVTARGLATLLHVAVARPRLRPVLTGLAVAGFSGTLATRFARAPAGRGVVRAKTGTLSGVSALAGVVLARDGSLLTFAFLAPSRAPRPRVEAALDRLAATLAGCGCR